MCLAPIALKKNYKTMEDSDVRNGSIGGLAHKVPCGKCPECLRRRQKGWVFRLKEELKVSTSAAFLTMTYDKEHLPFSFNGWPTLEKSDVQKFMKRLRKKMPKDVKLKYYTVGEYGTQFKRPHYHSIMFNLPQDYLKDITRLTDTWNNGIVSVDPCNMATITYVTKYVMKGRFEPFGELDDREPEFSIMSKKMGLNHLSPAMIKFYRDNFQSYVTFAGGEKFAMPRYFREKVFTKEERKVLTQMALEQSEEVFEKEFDSDYKKEHEWKKDQYRKAHRSNREERLKF